MHVTQQTTPVGSSHPIGAMDQYIMLLIPQTSRPSDSSGSMFINQLDVNEAWKKGGDGGGLALHLKCITHGTSLQQGFV